MKVASDGLAVRTEVGDDIRRRLVEVREIARVLVHVHVGAHRVLGCVERGKVSLAEDADAFGHLDLAHEGREQGLELVGAGDLHERLGRRRGVAHGLGREDGEDAVAVGVVHQRLRGGGVELGAGIADHVDWVAACPIGREAGLELLIGLAA